MNSVNKSRINQKGSILPLAVVMIVILALIGLGLLRLGLNARLQAIRSTSSLAARAAADAGLTQAVQMMKAKLISDGNSWNNSTLPAQTSPYSIAGNAYGDASYTFNITGNPAAGFTINSTGTSANIQKTVHCLRVFKSAWFGIGVKEGVTLKTNAILATIPDGGELKIQTNSTGANEVVLNSGVIINGDVVVGPGGNTDNIISIKQNADITGNAYPAGEPISFKDVTAPTLPAPPWPAPDANGNIILNSSAQYNGTIQIASTVKVKSNDPTNPHVIIYFPGNVTLKNGAKLVIAENTVLDLYVGAILRADYGSQITNDNIPSSGTPTDAQITAAATSFFIYGTPTCSEINLGNSSDLYGAIYAPNANLTIFNSGNLYGAYVGNQSVEIKNSGGFYFVSALLDIVGANQPTTYFGKARWWEE